MKQKINFIIFQYLSTNTKKKQKEGLIRDNRCLSHTTRKNKFPLWMAVPKKCTLMSKKCIRKNIWKKKASFSIVQCYSLAKSRSFLSSKEQPKPKPKQKTLFGTAYFTAVPNTRVL
jgi:hypothetical protein